MTPSVNPSTSIPYTALFDPDQLLQEEEQRKKQLQDSQKKIMRTNAIGEALRLITDAIGGSAGATIVQRPVNQSILNASQRYNALEDDYQATRQKYKLSDIASRQNLAQEDRQNKEWDRRFKTQEEATATRQGAENTEWDRRFEKQESSRQDEASRTTQRQKDVDTHQTDENIRQAKTIAEMKSKEVVRTDRSKPLYDDDIIFQVPGTTQKIYLGSEEVAEMAHRLIKMQKDAGNFISDPTLKAFERNEQVKMTSLLEVIKQNWDKVRYTLPEYAQDAPAEPSPQEKRKLDYDKKLQELYDDSSLKPRQRVKKINLLNKDYEDLFKQNAETSLIPADKDGVTDVTSIFNQ